MDKHVIIYDTTLRDGTQREGISLTLDDKLKIARKLDELGFDYVEGGWPGSNPKDIELFRKLKKEPLKRAKLVAFGSTRRKDTKAGDDPNLNALLESGATVACVFGKSWDLHVHSALATTLDENLKMVSESVNFLKSNGLEVIYDAEHFFNGYLANKEYALKTIKAANDAGAKCIVLCDTNGGMLTSQVAEVIKEVKESLPGVELGIHTHNDTECAVANTIAAVQEGVRHVQGTINGFGERCGNANLISVIANLQLKLGLKCLDDEYLSRLTELAHHVSEIANVTPDLHQPYVGKSAFAHKGGIHVSAVLKQNNAYEHIDPSVVGNAQKILVSELAGQASLIQKAKEMGIDLSADKDKVADILNKLKKKENQGYHFEVADGSLYMFLKKNTGVYRPLFNLESYEVTINRWRTGSFESEAILKINVDGKRVVDVAEGNGPVNALDRVLRKALEPFFPELSNIKLIDYKVRIFNEYKGTGAMVRVLLESTDGVNTWGTLGVSQNLIEASWLALVDSIEYGLTYKH
jgi:2-isopropylmalate synthase